MAIVGSPVKFVYLQTGDKPSNPNEDTIYFAPESNSIYVGDVPVVDGLKTNQQIATLQRQEQVLNHLVTDIHEDIVDIEQNVASIGDTVINVQTDIQELRDDVDALEASQISVDVSGEGNVVADAEFDTTTNKLTLVKGDVPRSSWEVIENHI